MNVSGIIFASDNEVKLNELTIHRTTASLPFGGRYRMIDFALSNFVNNGISKVGIITKNSYNSLMDHIRMGRDWDLNRKNSGITVFPPFGGSSFKEVYRDKIEALYSILNYLRRSKEEYVMIVNGNVAININLEGFFEEYKQKRADIMILCHRERTTSCKRVVLETDADCRVNDLMISNSISTEEKLVSLNAYFMHRDLLCGLIEGAYTRNMVDFERDILLKKLTSLNIYAYEYEGYAAIIDNVKTYYTESMRLLDHEVRDDLFLRNGKIVTKVKDSSPTVYKDTANVKGSLVADGCVIEGTVENSILFRNVKVRKGAVVKNSIIMEYGVVGENASLSYVVTDKGVDVSDNRVLAGYETYPIVIVKDKKV